MTALRERVNEDCGGAGCTAPPPTYHDPRTGGDAGPAAGAGSIYPGTFQGLYILDRWQGVVPGMELVFEGVSRCPPITPSPTPGGTRWRRCTTQGWCGSPAATCPSWSGWRSCTGRVRGGGLYNDVVKHDNVAANMAAHLPGQRGHHGGAEPGPALFRYVREQQRRFWNVMQAQSVMKSNFGMQLVNRATRLRIPSTPSPGSRRGSTTPCASTCPKRVPDSGDQAVRTLPADERHRGERPSELL